MSDKRKLPEMPVVPPKDGLERRNAYTRLNPKGHEELVVKHKGKPDEETLNELADDLLDLIESVSFGQAPALSAEQPLDQRAVNQNSPPQLVASRGDPVRASGETLTNMSVAPQTSDTGLGLGPTPADSPELSRAKAPIGSNPLGGRPISKYNRGSTGDGLDLGATHSESFVGTGAIAFAPGLLGSQQPSSSSGTNKKKKRDRGSENKDTTTNRLESSMSTRRTINEWLPPFKANGYNPGEHQMPKPAGKGVADRSPSQDSVGAYDTDLSGFGKEWPREGHDNEAMDRVDDENISHSAEGAHESTHGEPDDGHQKKVGHDWPKQPKNSGQGVAELFGGDRWSDGGTLPTGHGPGGDTWTHTEGPGMPSDGPITGTDGPQLGHVSEGTWSPDNMARLMGEDFDVQGLFNNYARTASAVCVEDFQNLLDAHGAGIVIDESSLLSLMDDNAEFMFYEGRDTDGSYWTPEAITEGENRRPFAKAKALNEDISSWDEPARSRDAEEGIDPSAAYAAEFGEPGEDDDPMAGIPDDVQSLAPAGPPGGGLMDSAGGDLGGEMGMGANLECPGCGYQGEDAECPECGVEMMDPMGDMGDIGGEVGGLSSNDEPLPPPPMESRRRTVETGPGIVESLKNFMESARSLIERNPKARSRDLAEALNQSWSYHAGSVDARTCPTKVQQTLQGLMRKFPGFNPLVENDAMERPEGTKLGGGDGPKVNLPKQPTEMTTHGDKSLLGKKQNGKAMAASGDDAVAGEPTLSGTGKGMGRSMNESAVAGAAGQAPGAQATAGAAPAAPAARPTAAAPQRQPAVAPKPQPQTARPATPQANGVATQAVQENIQKLAAHVKRAIAEGARALGQGKYTTEFTVLVVEGAKPAFLKGKKDKTPAAKSKGGKPDFLKGKDKGKDSKGKPAFLKKNRTPKRDSLAEALADAEEILQLHNPSDVTFEATFLGPNGQVALKRDIPLFTINPRGPMVGEGKALFRFHRNAEAFAEELVAEGVTCRVVPHNWGSAVEARTDYPAAQRAFRTLAESGEGCATLPPKKKQQKQKA